MMLNKINSLITDEHGQGMTEYGLVLGIISIAVVGILVSLKEEIVTIFNEALGNIQSRNTVTTP